MTKEERKNLINEADEMSVKIKSMLFNIVWEKQEGQEEHFDKLCKSEQVALIGLLNDASQLVQSISMYKSWFTD